MCFTPSLNHDLKEYHGYAFTCLFERVAAVVHVSGITDRAQQERIILCVDALSGERMVVGKVGRAPGVALPRGDVALGDSLPSGGPKLRTYKCE